MNDRDTLKYALHFEQTHKIHFFRKSIGKPVQTGLENGE